MVFRVLAALTVLLLGSVSAVHATPLVEVADLIIFNANVIPAATNLPLERAVAVRDGKILAVGKDKHILHYKGPETRVIDAQGATLLPGLTDNLVYAYKAAMSELDVTQPPIHSIADGLDFIRKQAAAKKANEWITVNWVYPTRLKEGRLPTKAELDAAAPKNPVYWNCGAMTMANSKAFEVSKINTMTPIPIGSEVRIGDDRKYSGLMLDASDLLKVSTNKPAAADRRRTALKNLFKAYNQQGITSITEHDATPEAIDLFREMSQAGELTVRISCDRFLPTTATPDDAIKRLNALTNAPTDKLPYGPTGVGDDWVRIGHLTMKMDGDITSGTAYLRTPWGIGGTYQILEPAYKGQIFQDPDVLSALVLEAAQGGWQVGADCSGDAALDQLLNCYQKVQFKNDIRLRRFLVNHGRFQAKQAWERCQKLGICTDMQPVALYKDGDSLIKTLGERRLVLFLPFQSYFANKMVVGAGSGHRLGLNANDSINPFNPWLGMWTAVSRITEQGAQTRPEEKISREQALELYTSKNAWLTFEETKKGTIEPGKFADLVLVDTDILKCVESELKDTKAILTVVGGKVVWSAK